MTGGAQVHQIDLLCLACGGQCLFDPRAQELTCHSCGTYRPLSSDGDARAADEFPYDPDRPEAEQPAFQGEQIHKCQTCGGEVVFAGPSLSDRCAYCDGPVVRGTEQSAFETMAVIPFARTHEDAARGIAAWIKGRIAAPDDLKDIASQGRLAPIYVPFWTFDSQEAVEYWATYVVGSGKHRRTRETTGKMRITFDDLLVPASPHVTPLIRDGILHDFDPSRLRAYQPGFIAGFAAERHHMTVDEGLRANADDKDLLIRNRIIRKVDKRGTEVQRYRTDTTGIHYRRILLPVWILHYSYGGRAKKIVVSGIDGRTYGERPFSRSKLAAYAFAVTVLTVLVGLVWGAVAVM
ncbi:ribosomal protein S27E [Rubricella aquisinus]|uniref:Ribosomal protein S27E n=1 Tax=Rubricella aquisinus TaxID=2028108 RepID=A0A840X052_9RHOB|nr:hypothetical protein [Rubricella aquisinus]MBB5515276.1 ribosomal protein S27E [Rubricella aquisinus]